MTTSYMVLGRPLDTCFRALLLIIRRSRPVAVKERSDLAYGRRQKHPRAAALDRQRRSQVQGFALNASSCVLAAFGRRWGGLPRVGPVPTKKLLAGADIPTGRIVFLRL